MLGSPVTPLALGARELAGSNPAIPTTLSRNSVVEFFSDTEAVVGSNPTVTT